MTRAQCKGDRRAEEAGHDAAQPASPDHSMVQRISRRTRILEESLAAAAAGYEEVNIRDVAQRAGVAVGTIYRYFPSKEHLFVSALGRWLEDFEQHVGPRFYAIDDPYERLWHVLEGLHRAFSCRPLLAKAMARACTVADPSLALEVETVRSQLVDLFADAVSRGAPTGSQIDVAGLVADVLASNLFALAYDRSPIGDIRRRLRLMIELLAKRHGEAIGSPDWHGTRSVGEQSQR